MVKASVIITVCNGERYIEDTVESVRHQTLQDIEIICINDGSTDSSLQILERLAEKDDRIHIITRNNSGLSSACNTGLSQAKGEYLLFMNSEDIIIATMLEELYCKCTQMELDILYFSGTVFFETETVQNRFDEGVYNSLLRKGTYDNPAKGVSFLVELQDRNDLYNDIGLQFIKREFLIRNNLFFFGNITGEDSLFTFQCLIHAERTFCIPEIYLYKRIHESMLSQKDIDGDLYSFYYGYQKQISAVSQLELSKTQCTAVCSALKDIGCQINEMYQLLSSEEAEEFFSKCSPMERIWFDLLVIRDDHKEYAPGILQFNTNNKLVEKLSRIENSSSYRIGRIITAIPRRIKNTIRKKRKNDPE